MIKIKLTFITFIIFIITMHGQTVTCDNVYTMDIPSNMYLMDQNPDAVFEIANYAADQYLMVIHESKLDFKQAINATSKTILSEYANVIADGFNESFNSKTKISDIYFNNYNAKKLEIEGQSGGISIIWHTIAVETELYLYQICYWTTPGNTSNSDLKKLLNTAKTFKEL
jgi:hypothetical protein